MNKQPVFVRTDAHVLPGVDDGGEVRKILALLADGTIDQHPNWKGRFKENSDKMRTGSLFEVAVVLKGLTYLSRKKALSFREKRMLDRARFLIITEVSEVTRELSGAIEGRVARVSPTIDLQSQSVTVYVQVPNGTGSLKGNTFATGQIIERALEDLRSIFAGQGGALRRDRPDLVPLTQALTR